MSRWIVTVSWPSPAQMRSKAVDPRDAENEELPAWRHVAETRVWWKIYLF